jgi:hypothetical protein
MAFYLTYEAVIVDFPVDGDSFFLPGAYGR